MTYLVLDTETGGLDPNHHSLLSAAFFVVDEKATIVDELEMFLRPTKEPGKGMYVVTANALEVNRINLVAHDAKALYMGDAETKLGEFLKKNTEVITGLAKTNYGRVYPGIEAAHVVPYTSLKKIERLTVIGHNPQFDVGFIKAQLFQNWEHFVSYRMVDTAAIARFLIDAGLLKTENNQGSLGHVAKALGIEYQAHDAREDALATMKVYFRMIELVKKPKLRKLRKPSYAGAANC